MLRSYLELHFIVLVWGFTAILGKLIHVPPTELVWLRTLIAVRGLALLMRSQGTSFRVNRADLGRLLGTGVLIAAHWLLFFASARVSNVSICLAGLSTASLWVALLEPVFTRKRLQAHEIGLAAGIFVGLYLIFRFEFDQALGLAMGVGSALFAALFTIINAKFAQRLPSTAISFYELRRARGWRSPFSSPCIWHRD